MNQPVNVVIFAARETPQALAETLLCAVKGLTPGSRVDVLINGNPDLSDEFTRWAKQHLIGLPSSTSIWFIPAADKANAWNQHIRHIWPGQLNAVYVDGYVRVSAGAISALQITQSMNPLSLGTSGVPTSGNSALKLQNEMLSEGGFHGNLCAIRSDALQAMRDGEMALPVGLYRVDSTMGAFLSFGLNNALNDWKPHQYLPLTKDAHWHCDPKRWWRWRDLKAWHQRKARQARGDFENAAVRHHLAEERRPMSSLPRDVRQLVTTWERECPKACADMKKRSRRHANAWSALMEYQPPQPSDLKATLVWEA